ncbi:MAG TPA: type IV secretory system conjugative DNA transfer family protein [Acidimicrobiales bacterium]|nr:type IV secretory system conjugative DNA transfer family protein [Acidimicrobiales bacterium]
MAGPLDDYQRQVAATGGRLYAGSVSRGLALAGPQQSLLVLGPPRSGKTCGVAVPNTIAAPGSVVSTSTKPDVLAATTAARSRMGRCWLLDPSGSMHAPAGVEVIRWSPVASARTWEEALLLARSMTAAARPAGRMGEAAHWTERAEALLAPLLHAAHLRGSGMDTVIRWVLRHETDEAATVLHSDGPRLAADVLAGIEATDPREQSGIWSSAAGVLAAYRSEQVLDRSDRPNFDPARLAAGRDTVYVCAPARQQDLIAPIVVAFLDQARAGAFAGTGRHLPLTLVLDELANIAPIPDLPALISEGGSQGVLTVGCLQDLSQARARWGPSADGFLSLFGAKLVLPGIGDMATLDLVSRLGGEIEAPSRSVSRSPWWSRGRGTPTVTWSGHRQRRIPVESVRQQPAGSAILLNGSEPPVSVRLPPYWAIPALNPMAERRPPTRTIGR